jgi:TonB family protein
MRFLVSPEGRALRAEIERSSGFEELDKAAQQSILNCNRFKPGMKDGVPVESWARVAYEWKLDEPPTRNWYVGPHAALVDVTTLNDPAPRAQFRMRNWAHYPDGAKARREQGTVIVRLRVGTDKRIAETEVMQSSGSADLDREPEHLRRVHAAHGPGQRRGKPHRPGLPLETAISVELSAELSVEPGAAPRGAPVSAACAA